jgi:hypothetical protein
MVLSTGFALFRGQKIVKKREKRAFFLVAPTGCPKALFSGMRCQKRFE